MCIRDSRVNLQHPSAIHIPHPHHLAKTAPFQDMEMVDAAGQPIASASQDLPNRPRPTKVQPGSLDQNRASIHDRLLIPNPKHLVVNPPAFMPGKVKIGVVGRIKRCILIRCRCIADRCV